MNQKKSALLCLVLGVALSSQAVSILQFTNVPSGLSGQLNRVAYDGMSNLVAVGLNSSVTSARFTAGNPLTWASNTFVAPGLRLKAVTYGQGQFVVGGQDARVFSSGLAFNDWTNRNNANGLQADVEGLAFGNNGRFAAPDSFIQTFWTTNLNVAWQQSSYTAQILESYRDATLLGTTNFAICGILGTIRVSVDSALNFGNNRPLNINEPDLFGIAAGTNGMIVAVGEAGEILYSTSAPWQVWVSPPGLPLAATLNGVAYNERWGFIAVGDAGTILTSPDGMTWTTNASPVSAGLRGAVFPSTGFLSGVAAMVGNNGTIVLAGTEPPMPVYPVNATNCANEPNLPLCVSTTNNLDHPDGTTTIDWFAADVGGAVLTNGMATNCYTPTDTLPPGYGLSSNFTYYAQSRDLRTGFVNPDRTAVTLTIHPVPVGFADTTNTCSDVALSYNLQTNVNNLAMGGNGVLSTFTWVATNDNLNVTGQSTTPVAGEVITNVLRNITAEDQTVIYAATPVSTYDCTGEVFTVTVTVYPEPVATNVTLTSCSSVPLAFLLQSAVTNGVDSRFLWVATNNNANVTGQSATVRTNATLNDILTNLTVTPQPVIYAVTPISTAHDCTGKVFVVTVNVYPEPAATNVALAYCSSVPLNFDLQSAVTNGVTVSNFTWTATSDPNVSGATPGSGLFLTNLLVNTSATDGTVTYQVTPTSFQGCTGKVFTVSLTVHPEPVAGNLQTNICSSVPLSVPLAGAVTNGVAVTNFTWTYTNAPNVSGATAGAGLTLTNLLVNTSATDGVVLYQVTPISSQGCTGKVFAVSVLVHPEPVGTNVVQTLCNGDPFVFSLQTAISNQVLSTFTWMASSNTNVTGQTTNAQTSDTINDPLNNLTTNVQNVVYQVLPVSVADGCTGKLFTVTATIYPRPTATVLAETNNILQGDSAMLQVDLTGTGPWTVTWSDGVTSNNVASTPAYRSVSPTTTTVYSVTNLVDAQCIAQPGDLTGESTVVVLQLELDIYLTNANQNVVVTWFGDAALLSATDLATTPITWTFLTNGTAGVTNSWIDAIALPPTNTFYSLTNN